MKNGLNIFFCTGLAIVTFGYLMPTAISTGRRLKNGGSIFVINLFLGWTLLGWVVALAWAVSGSAEKKLA